MKQLERVLVWETGFQKDYSKQFTIKTLQLKHIFIIN